MRVFDVQRESKATASVRTTPDVDSFTSVIGPGMKIKGDVDCSGAVRIEGHIEGAVRAKKAVVVGKEGSVVGDIDTQDILVSGRVEGTIKGASRVELEETCNIQGDIHSRHIKLAEGGRVDGRLRMGDAASTNNTAPAKGGSQAAAGRSS